MDIESIRSYCLSLPHATEDVKWGADLCFLIGGKMFAVASLEGASGARLSFKCTPEDFEQLVERDGNRDREKPRGSPLPHHRTSGSAYGGSVLEHLTASPRAGARVA